MGTPSSVLAAIQRAVWVSSFVYCRMPPFGSRFSGLSEVSSFYVWRGCVSVPLSLLRPLVCSPGLLRGLRSGRVVAPSDGCVGPLLPRRLASSCSGSGGGGGLLCSPAMMWQQALGRLVSLERFFPFAGLLQFLLGRPGSWCLFPFVLDVCSPSSSFG